MLYTISKLWQRILITATIVGEALAFVQDLLEAEADAIKNREPHATASIGRLNEAAYEVFSISNEIDAEEFDDGK